MLVRFIQGDRHRDLVLSVHDLDATVADLVAALAPGSPARGLVIDGRPLPASTPLDRAGIAHGAVLRLGDRGEHHRDDPRAAPGPTDPLVTVEVHTGPSSGTSLTLGTGPHLVGRRSLFGPSSGDPTSAVGVVDLSLDDPAVSTRHATIDVGADGQTSIRDLGSTNGTTIGGEVVLGTSRLAFRARREADGADVPVPVRPRTIHRTPRPRPQAAVTLPAPPPMVETAEVRTSIGVIALLSSVVVGLTMVLLLGSITYALFALLGPVLIVGHAADARLRHRRTRRRGTRRRARALTAYSAALTVAARREGQRRALHHLGMVEARRIAATGERLWERRPDDPDAYSVRVGTGDAPWTALADRPDRPSADDDAALAETEAPHLILSDVAIGIDLAAGSALAVVGPRPLTSALARSIVAQAATIHGPSDLAVGVLTTPVDATRWHWCRWLPHTTDDEGTLLAADPTEASALAVRLIAGHGGDPAPSREAARRTLLVVDESLGSLDRRSPSRTLLRSLKGSTLAVIVLVDRTEDVPAACETVLTVAVDGTLTGPRHLVTGRASMSGTSVEVAAEVARTIARWDDPEVDGSVRRLPARCRLIDLVGAQHVDPAVVAARWQAGRPSDPPVFVVGSGPDGPFELDLGRDGPHVLVAGTTGSGKSELLRTLVLGLALRHPPSHLSFVLVDFKGGSTFDRCAHLPHVVGVSTDLDAHGAARALRSLDAEIRHREQVVRQAGASDFDAFHSHGGEFEALARLVVVIDEFAALAHELPELVPSLVSLAQRGRSLGMHLVLATQRPGNAVSDDLRANVALRIALRVQRPAESTDIIDVADAAAIPRSRQGRALVRLGPGDLHQVQTASTSFPLSSTVEAVTVEQLAISTRCAAAADPSGSREGLEAPCEADTDGDRHITVLRSAWALMACAPPRRPWVDPLPADLPWPTLGLGSSATRDPDRSRAQVVLGLADEPDRQRQVPFTWDLDAGPLLVVGLPGSGTTTVLSTAALAVARHWTADDCHLHVVDHGAGRLGPLAGLPHVGAVTNAAEPERIRRLFDDLADDLIQRRATGGLLPRRVVLIDDLGALRASTDPLDPTGTWVHLEALVAAGAAVGIHLALAATGVGAAPHSLVSRCRQRLVMRLSDPADYGSFSIPAREVPELPPGRGIDPDGCRLVQVARPPEGLAAAVARLAGSSPPPSPTGLPRPVTTLPTHVVLSELQARLETRPGARDHDGLQDGDTRPSQDRRRDGDQPRLTRAADAAPGRVRLLVGLADHRLEPAYLDMEPGAHALIAGPARSGRTATLETLAASAEHVGLAVVQIGARPTGRTGWLDPDDPTLDTVLDGPGPMLVVVDDADLTADEHPLLTRVATERLPHRHLVAAGRTDRLRRGYAHWTRELRTDRLGLLLQPDPDLDGELLATQVPRRTPLSRAVGRGWLVSDDFEGFVQIATVDQPG